MLNNRILHRILSYQLDPEKLLSCCKKFTVFRSYNIRWKNRIYFKDNRIKIVNCIEPEYWYKCKEIWYKKSKVHQDDIDPETGLTLPAIIEINDKSKYWYKDGELHCDNIDPETGLTLPAIIEYARIEWYKNGKLNNVDIDPETGITLYSMIYGFEIKEWYKDGEKMRNKIDPDTGFTLPDIVWEDVYGYVYKTDIDLNPDLDPELNPELFYA
jgi:hypothetical protein